MDRRLPASPRGHYIAQQLSASVTAPASPSTKRAWTPRQDSPKRARSPAESGFRMPPVAAFLHWEPLVHSASEMLQRSGTGYPSHSVIVTPCG